MFWTKTTRPDMKMAADLKAMRKTGRSFYPALAVTETQEGSRTVRMLRNCKNEIKKVQHILRRRDIHTLATRASRYGRQF